MIRTEVVTVIDRPVDEVFAFVADFTTLPQYDRWVESVERVDDGPIGVGSAWTHRRTQGRRRIDAPIELVEYRSPRSFAMVSGSPGFEVRSSMTFEAIDPATTKVTELLEMRLSGLPRLFEPMIRRQVPGQGEEVHRQLKRVLEAG